MGVVRLRGVAGMFEAGSVDDERAAALVEPAVEGGEAWRIDGRPAGLRIGAEFGGGDDGEVPADAGADRADAGAYGDGAEGTGQRGRDVGEGGPAEGVRDGFGGGERGGADGVDDAVP